MNKLLFLALVSLATGCKEKYISPAPLVTTGYLVVEGVINNGGGVTNLKLSRTTDLKNNSNITERAAIVKLESSSNGVLQLKENFAGNYSIDNLQLDTSLKYRLNIITGNNEQYLSDFVKIRNNPPIDSISWTRQNKGVEIFVNTHDPQNNSLYYQWQYDETWEFHSAYFATLKYIIQANTGIKLGVTARLPTDPEMYVCYQSNSSTSLLLGSSVKLSQDIIHLPVTLVPNASWKLSVLYSVFVKQYTWSREGYDFLERMKKNTESVGSVFDAQPSELNGNIHCISNPALPVIGFFNICTVREKRIFIKNSELPLWGFSEGCTTEVIENNRDSILKKASGLLPVDVAKGDPFLIISFNAAPPSCVDCTLRGTNVKPFFWP
ncbi:MAG: hypothetical protein JWP81_1162 [Ferruginibacter sp.]|nr:hypothetical protein [Ferruginibacter sp.]